MTHTSHEQEGKRPGDKPDHDLVKVELNGIEKKIKEGDYTGRTLKLVLGVPVEHELDLVAKHEFTPIGNEDKIRIKGGERFVSHCGQGQSS